ncbi:Rid family detoxifying hydrolase [Glycomyces luteolus]|uniref:Rid family detoxifying hydrolase n=1 Tax=Glycomyces luteolus TaxID=2670330 RepID=A0A9X3PB86_9ACTN|nr:Rid family detoxifying hydrolase [Glycomyces luteolus]MDA1362151.1 Rid family detoxifying hydrolase [Glycomyces luteolus]
MKSINYATDLAPTPAGPYAQAKQRGNLLAVAGQIGVDPANGRLADGFKAQADMALRNLGAVLAEAGASFEDVLMFRVYLTNTADFAAMNAVFAEFAPKSLPARTTVYVGLPEGIHIEVDALAVLA